MSAIASAIVRPSVNKTAVTPDDLLHMEDRGLYELVDGKLVEKKMAYLSNLTAGRIARFLGNHFDAVGSGDAVLPEQSFQCFTHAPSRIRRPDIAVITAARIPAVYPTGHVEIVPDLAVEVVSPNDNVYELDLKLADYRLAGVPMTWVVNPEARVIRMHRPGKAVDELFDGDVLRGDPVFPGFAVNVTDLLPPKVAMVEQATA